MVCRLCFSNSEQYIEIFSEEKISKCIKQFLELEITDHDPVSKLICEICWQQLKVFQSFYLRIKEVQRELPKKLKKESLSAEKELEPVDGSSFHYANNETDDCDLNEHSEISIQNEEQILPDNNGINTTTGLSKNDTIKNVRHYKKLSKSTRSFRNEQERKFFVDLMRKEEVIWNRTHNLHSSSRALIEAWKRIAQSMPTSKTVHECKIMWKSLRDALRYERRKAAGGFKQGNELRNLLYFISPSNGQRKSKNTTEYVNDSPQSTKKSACSDRICEGSASDMSAYSDGQSRHFSHNLSFEAVDSKPHSTEGQFSSGTAPETMNHPPTLEYKSAPTAFYVEVKNEFKDEVSDLVESISKSLNRLVNIATAQQVKARTFEFKYEYIWKLIECLYAQMEQSTINDLNQRIINMVYEGSKIDVY